MQKLPGEARGHGALVTALVTAPVVMKMFAPLAAVRCSVAASPHFPPGHADPSQLMRPALIIKWDTAAAPLLPRTRTLNLLSAAVTR